MTNSTGTQQQISLANAIFLVAGTCIGGGMLALPVVSGQAGFWPSFFSMILAWLAMTGTALCLIELGLWLAKKNCHVISLAEAYLGPWGKGAAWILFLFMSYASIIAYIAGSGHLFAHGLTALGMTCPKTIGCLLFTLIFGPFVFLPPTKLAKLNSFLFYAMIAAFVALIAIGLPYVKEANIQHTNWSLAYTGIPLILTSFSFQTMAPSLAPLLGYNRKKLWLCCSLGTLIPFFVYVLWEWVVLGAVPLTGNNGLMQAFTLGEPATFSLRMISQNPMLPIVSDFFAFFALVTSFLGLALGLFDFLADGLHIPKNTKGRLILTALVLLPSLLAALFFERAFLVALDVSGGFGDTLLNGIMPILMVWTGASLYLKKKGSGRPFLYSGLLALALIFLTALGCEIYSHVKMGDTIYDNKVVDVIELEASQKSQ